METSRLLKQFIALSIFIAMMVLSGCASMLRFDGPYEGKVIDAETKQPIEGAVVHGSWYKVQLGGAHEYYDSYEVQTDKNGEFKIPGKGLLVLSEIEEMTLIIFKAGYKQWPPNIWSGLKEGKWPNDEVVWNDNKGTFKLLRRSLEERRSDGVILSPIEPARKQRLLIIESNREKTEIGRPSDTLLPVE